MSGKYKGMQRKVLEVNNLAIYVPCAAHSLNLVGRSAVDCCLEAVKFFGTVQNIYTFFAASTHRWKVLTDHLSNEKVVKDLSDTRWEAHSAATEAIKKSFGKLLEALECLADDDTQKGETRQEAEGLINRMQELEFAIMLVFWEEILQQFSRVSKAVQKVDVNLKACADLYASLVDFIDTARSNFTRYENEALELVPGSEYRAVHSRQRRRKSMPNDGNAKEAALNPRDKFRTASFYVIIDKLRSEMEKRMKIYQEIADRFSFLIDYDLSEASDSKDISELRNCCQKLSDIYPGDLSRDWFTEFEQFKFYIRHKFSGLSKDSVSHAEIYRIIIDDNLECVFPNVETSLRIFLSLMVTNCSTERSFSQLKHIKDPNRSTMGQGRLDSLSLFKIHPDLVRKIDLEKVSREFAVKKSRKKFM